MRNEIQPKVNDVEVHLTTGSVIKIKSCYGKANLVLKLDVDPFNHPAWKKEDTSGFVNTNNNTVATFSKKYGDIF